MFMHPRVQTGLATIIETDDFQPITLSIDYGVEWMFPGMREQSVASFHAKKLEITKLAERFDVQRSQSVPGIPFHQYARYQPRSGIERRWVSYQYI